MTSAGLQWEQGLGPKPTKKNFHPEFVEQRKLELDNWLQELCRYCYIIWSDPKLTYEFTKFIAPVQMGDIKPPAFVMPFTLEPA